MNTARLHDAIAAVCPIVGVSIGRVNDKNTWRFTAKPEATPAQISDAEAVIATWDSSQSADDAATKVSERTVAVAMLASAGHEAKLLRALLLTILEEMNLHAARIKSILDAIDGASTLAQVKTAVAAIADPPQRTAGDVRASMANKLNIGAADN